MISSREQESAVVYHELSMVVWEKSAAETEISEMGSEVDFIMCKGLMEFRTDPYVELWNWVDMKRTYMDIANDTATALGVRE